MNGPTRYTSAESFTSFSHRHLIVRHRHSNWHGHCDVELAGSGRVFFLRPGWPRCKPCAIPHWHLWWRHDHA